MAIGLIGVVLVGGGIWLVAVGGSAYYALAGAGLVVAGYLLVHRRATGAWVYALVFAATVVWAVWEAGLNGWALVPRVLAPLVLLVLVILATPRLTPFRHGWRTSVSAAVAILVAAVAGLGIAYEPEKGMEPVAIAAPAAVAMADPSPMTTGADWPAYGGTYSARRYSPLEQITPQNVAQLRRAWTFHTGDLPNERTKNTYGAETTPLKIGDTLYLCTPKNIMIALDVESGKPVWHFQTVHNDVWDYDLGSQATLIDFPAGQGTVPALLLPSKRGDIFVLDRRTGQPLTGVEERLVPQGCVFQNPRTAISVNRGHLFR